MPHVPLSSRREAEGFLGPKAASPAPHGERRAVCFEVLAAACDVRDVCDSFYGAISFHLLQQQVLFGLAHRYHFCYIYVHVVGRIFQPCLFSLNIC